MSAKQKEPKTIDQHLSKMKSKKNLGSRLQRYGLILLVFGMAYIMLSSYFDENYDIIFPFATPLFLISFFGSIALILGGYYIGMYVEVYEDFIAEKAIPTVLQQVMDRLDEFDKEKTFRREIIDEADMGLVTHYERLEGEDYTKGIFRGISIEMAEFRQQDQEKDDKDDMEYWVNKFCGLMILCRHNRELTEDISITQYATYIGSNVVHTESIEFNELFSVKGKDEHSIFLLLTPPFMEELIKISNAIGKRLGINYKKDGRLMICISDFGLFEVGEVQSQEELLNKFKGDMDFIGEILRVLEVPTEAELQQ